MATAAAFLFVFLPIHDAATYWYTGQSYLLTGALYLCAYVLCHEGHGRRAAAFATFASFTGYGSTPYALGMAYLAWRKQGMRAAMSLLAPNLIYIVYYVVLTKVLNAGIDRLPHHASLLTLAKQFALQIATGLDALVGPSMWLKVVLATFEISWVSALLALLALGLLVFPVRVGLRFGQAAHRDVVVAFLIVAVASWGMFAVTGFYPQIAFNLGDRVTLWGSLLVAYLIACVVVRNRAVYGLAMAALLLSVLGNADHWKRWDVHQQQVIGNIRANSSLAAGGAKDLVFVTGNQYSKLGPISNIEFMSEDYSTASVFRHALRDRYQFTALPLSSRYSYEPGALLDRKASRRYPVGATVYIYDSESDRLTTVAQDRLPDILASLPREHRHWTQLLDQGVMSRLAVFLMPRLQYAL